MPAAGIGGHLVTITSAAENDLVKSMVSTLAYNGLFDETVEGTFVWTNDEPLSYTNWGSGEPNNGGGNNEDYTLMRADGTWNDGGGPSRTARRRC